MLNQSEESHRLNKLLGDVVISQGGVVPHIAAVSSYIVGLGSFCPYTPVQELLPTKSSKSKKDADDA